MWWEGRGSAPAGWVTSSDMTCCRYVCVKEIMRKKSGIIITVVLQILQTHSWLEGLVDFLACCTSLDLLEGPVQQPFPMGLADLLPSLTEREVLPPGVTMGGLHFVQELV